MDQSGTIPSVNFHATGSDVCLYLTHINEAYASSDGFYSYSTDGGPICDDKSGIDFKLYHLDD